MHRINIRMWDWSRYNDGTNHLIYCNTDWMRSLISVYRWDTWNAADDGSEAPEICRATETR